jgi:signal transduction histidine kinase
MTLKPLNQWSPRAVLAGTFLVFLGPFLMVELFPSRLDTVIAKSSYLVFHNIAEFFSIMVSLSVFSVGWYTYDQSKDRHALFLGTAFLAVGLLDFMHTMSNAAMPDFLTPNSTNKSTQFWIAARLADASAFLASAFIYPEKQHRWLSKTTLLTAALSVTGLVFLGVTFFPEYLPATAVPGVGLTPLKRSLEFAVIFLLLSAGAAYGKRMARTGDRLLLYYLAAFVICIFSEAVFASYKTGFDTYNVLGHIYKVIAFYLIYKGVFISSVNAPYVELADMSGRISRLNAELEERVRERTFQLESANRELEAFSYSVSHDLRAPLRAIDGFSRAIEEEQAHKLDDAGKDYFRRVRAAASRMSLLVDGMLNLSRHSRGELTRTPVDLSALARGICEDLARSRDGRSVECIIPGGIAAQGDAEMLRVALQNLLENAWKFTGKCDTARVELGAFKCGMWNAEFGIQALEQCEQGETVYFIRDNGAGFDMTYADKLFTAFQRLHTADDFPGLGIGLATVRRIINRHGGRIWAVGETDKGATFYFTL